MDQKTANQIVNHLRALVNLQALKITLEHRGQVGFSEQTKMLLNEAYSFQR